MNEKVKKVFDLLGVEPNERFKVDGCGNPTTIFTIDENLFISDDRKNIRGALLTYLLRGDYKIIKLPKEPKKKKLRDLTEEEWNKWRAKNCNLCYKCVFKNVYCESLYGSSWVNHKDLYSDKFLNQEIEVEE